MCSETEIRPYTDELVSYCREKFGFKNPPSIFFSEDEENAKNPLGKTAYYDPAKKSVTVFISGRHVKDVLRSLAHELVHHAQNLRGDLQQPEKMSRTYAQDNPHMRNMEKEAYTLGNITFRDWEDKKKNKIQIGESNMKNGSEIIEGASSPKDKKGNKRYVKHPETGEPGVVVSVLDGKHGVRYAISGMRTHAKGVKLKSSSEEAYKSAQRKDKNKTKKEANMKKIAEKKIIDIINKVLNEKYYKRDDKDLEESHEENITEMGSACGEEPTYRHGYDFEGDNWMDNLSDEEVDKKIAELEALRQSRGSHGAALDRMSRFEENNSIEENEEETLEENEEETLEENEEETLEENEDSKVLTPEHENAINEERFTGRNNKIFERLLNKWTK